MGFDYDKIRHGNDESYWATYSDLFINLSFIFLLLYVVSSLKTGTQSVIGEAEKQAIARERDDLKQQIKVYNTLKEDYLETGATEDEQKGYEQLMDKIALLKEEAKDEKNKLRLAAQENAEKEDALNQYQQMVRNIINNNMISQARIKRRDKTIDKKNVVIKDNRKQIAQLNDNLKEKQKEVELSADEIQKVNKRLEIKVSQLKSSYLANRITKEKMEQSIKDLKDQNTLQVSELESVNERAKQEVRDLAQVLKQSENRLNQAQSRLDEQGEKLAALVEEKNQFREKIDGMNKEFEDQLKREKAAFDSEVARQKMSAQDKAAKLAAFRKQAAARQAELASEIQGLEAQADAVQKDLDSTLLAKNQLAAKASQLEGANKNLSRDVARLQELADAKNKAIGKIADNLKKAGINASVDKKSGDVVISFGQEYFDTGKASLKPGMENILHRFMPTYSSSLLSDPEIAEKIQSIEIIGYASPTYKGKYVDPKSLKAADKAAINYNLDLSYYRARSIFDYVFDTNKMQYKYQKDILPMVKVTGRSFLAEGSTEKEAATMSQDQYCKKYDCNKSQRVMIKFNMQP